jgi:hypothetical protein
MAVDAVIAASGILPPFCNHVGCVLLRSSEEKMGGIAAAAVIAPMADGQAFGKVADKV